MHFDDSIWFFDLTKSNVATAALKAIQCTAGQGESESDYARVIFIYLVRLSISFFDFQQLRKKENERCHEMKAKFHFGLQSVSFVRAHHLRFDTF